MVVRLSATVGCARQEEVGAVVAPRIVEVQADDRSRIVRFAVGAM